MKTSINKESKIATLTCLILFAILAVLVKAKLTQGFDLAIQDTVKPLTNPGLTKCIAFITKFGSPMATAIIIVIMAGFLWLKKNRFASIWAILLFVSGAAVLSIVKKIIARPRPVSRLVAESSFSFPSGHTFGTALLVFTAFALILPYFKKWRTIISAFLIFWIIFIPLTRIYLLVHYPTDILGGFLLAAAWWGIFRWLTNIFVKKTIKN